EKQGYRGAEPAVPHSTEVQAVITSATAMHTRRMLAHFLSPRVSLKLHSSNHRSSAVVACGCGRNAVSAAALSTSTTPPSPPPPPTATATTTTTTTRPAAPASTQPPAPSPAPVHKKTSVTDVAKIHRQGKRKISMVTAYDYPSAIHVCRAGIDILLVGDSLGMVELGYETTQPVTVEDMLHHCKAVSRGARSPLVVGDLPFGSYEVSPEQALRTSIRFVKEGNVEAVKLEGGKNRVEHIRKIVDGGIAVMGHVGLTPQAISVLGGFRAQGRTAVKAKQVVEDALAVQEAGAFAVVVECVPSPVARAVTEALDIPTIGIGAGPCTSGQVLVYHDMLGMLQHPHHGQFVPRFCKSYASVGDEVRRGLENFRREVEGGVFPQEKHSPYKMPPGEEEAFLLLLRKARYRTYVQARLALERKNLEQGDNDEDDDVSLEGPYGSGGGAR
ncbi:unnamed protein product, partial [Pylaiella littoralis]